MLPRHAPPPISLAPPTPPRPYSPPKAGAAARGEAGMAATEQPGAARLWAAGEVYEPYVGRWSRLVAPGFLAWLGMPPGLRWIDVGDPQLRKVDKLQTTAR